MLLILLLAVLMVRIAEGGATVKIAKTGDEVRSIQTSISMYRCIFNDFQLTYTIARDDRTFSYIISFLTYFVNSSLSRSGLDPSRRDRDGRERPRSRVRDTSRQRGSPPQRRGDRDEKDKDKDRESIFLK